MYKYFEKTGNRVSSWKSKGLSDEKISTSNNISINPSLVYDNAKIRVKFALRPLIQNKVTYRHGPIVNIYIVYRLISATINTDTVSENSLFGAVKVINTSDPDPDKWQYSDYGICFDSTGSFTHPDGNYGKNVIIFGANLSNKNMLITKEKIF